MGGIRVDLLPLREINCNGSVEEKLRCVPSASLSDRGSGVLQRHTSVPNLAFARIWCRIVWYL